MKSYKARGIVLNTVKYGDSGLVAQLLTDLYGRQSYMVQGVRSSRGHGSKMALLQPMFAVEFEGLESSHMELHRFRELRSGLQLQSTPFDARKSAISLFMAEILYRLVRESEPNEQLFRFVWGSVEALDSMQEGVANFHLWFLANLSRFLGFSPTDSYVPDSFFDMKEGAFTSVAPLHEEFMQPQEAVLLRDLLECDVRYLGEIGLNRNQRVDFLEALLRYYNYHLSAIGTVKSVHILQELF